MFSIKTGKFLHHLDLTALDRRITQIVILVLGPSGTHKYLHPLLGGLIHNRIHRTLPLGRIMPVHQFRRIVGLALVRHRHKHKILHTHLFHLYDLCRPHLRVGRIDAVRVCVFIAYILVWKVDECACNRKSLLSECACASPKKHNNGNQEFSHIISVKSHKFTE